MAEEDLEAVQARHRKELRDLQSRITNKKKNATKKTRKGINDECAELERQLKEKQAQELAALSGEATHNNNNTDDVEEEEEQPVGQENGAVDGVTEDMKKATISPPQPEESPITTTQQQAGKKRNRQKERLARRAAEQEAAAHAAAAEAANMTDHRKLEKTYLLKQFAAHKLEEHEIQPDGHCLFSAVADQLSQYSIPLSPAPETQTTPAYKTVRRRAAEYMAGHAEDFAPFLELEGETDFETYVGRMRDTAEWGGQLELAALANVYGVEIRVVQDGRTETIEPRDRPEGCRTIWLAYYRHGYGLGEHYNSLRRKAE